jgi:hypothetical protein
MPNAASTYVSGAVATRTIKTICVGILRTRTRQRHLLPSSVACAIETVSQADLRFESMAERSRNCTVGSIAVCARRAYLEQMTETSATSPIPVSGLKLGSTRIIDELHFTGGLRAVRDEGGWQIGPLLRDGGLGFVPRVPEGKIRGLGVASCMRRFASRGRTCN